MPEYEEKKTSNKKNNNKLQFEALTAQLKRMMETEFKAFRQEVKELQQISNQQQRRPRRDQETSPQSNRETQRQSRDVSTSKQSLQQQQSDFYKSDSVPKEAPHKRLPEKPNWRSKSVREEIEYESYNCEKQKSSKQAKQLQDKLSSCLSYDEIKMRLTEAARDVKKNQKKSSATHQAHTSKGAVPSSNLAVEVKQSQRGADLNSILPENQKQEIVSASNNEKVQVELSPTNFNDSMTGMMHLSFSKSVETGTEANGEQRKQADLEKELPTQVSNPKSALDPTCSMMSKENKLEPQVLFESEPNNKWKSKLEQGFSHAMSKAKLSANVIQHHSLDFLTVLKHLSCLKEVELGIAKQEERPGAYTLSKYEGNEYEQSVLEPVPTADLVLTKRNFRAESLLSLLRIGQVGEAQDLNYYWDSFITNQCSRNYAFEFSISSIMHLFFSLSVNKGAGSMENCKGLEEELPCSIQIKEKPPDAFLQSAKQHTRGAETVQKEEKTTMVIFTSDQKPYPRKSEYIIVQTTVEKQISSKPVYYAFKIAMTKIMHLLCSNYAETGLGTKKKQWTYGETITFVSDQKEDRGVSAPLPLESKYKEHGQVAEVSLTFKDKPPDALFMLKPNSKCQQQAEQAKSNYQPHCLISSLSIPTHPWNDISIDLILGLHKTRTESGYSFAVADVSLNLAHFDNNHLIIDALHTFNLFSKKIICLHGLIRKDLIKWKECLPCAEFAYDHSVYSIFKHFLFHIVSQDHTDMIHLSWSEVSKTGFTATLKHPAKAKTGIGDKRFIQPVLDQEKVLDVLCLILMKEEPPDAAYKPKPSQNKDQTDLRSNPFQVGEDDMIMNKSWSLEHGEEAKEQLEAELEPEEQLEPEHVATPEGPMTRSRVKRIKEAETTNQQQTCRQTSENTKQTCRQTSENTKQTCQQTSEDAKQTCEILNHIWGQDDQASEFGGKAYQTTLVLIQAK